jgi:cobalt/nickel transport system ATP-binding protein
LATDDVFVCEGLGFAYHEKFTALDDVSFRVARGEKIALLGANGCGKSTLLKILDGLVFPEVGTIEAFGAPLTEDNLEDEQFSTGFRSRVAFIFQNSDAQVFSPTVREEIAFGPLQMGWPTERVEGRIADVMRMLDIEDLAERAPFQLSGGQKKKVAIASVLVMNPEVLLFDEPTAALDPRSQQWLIELIVELNEAGKTIVMATHDLDVLDVVADRCLVFSEDHRIVAEGDPATVMADRDLLLGVNLIHEHSHWDPSLGKRAGERSPTRRAVAEADEEELKDVIDPVCGMDVTRETAAGAWEHEGQTYYFCSVGCLERFKADPGRYVDLDPSERSMG